MRVGIDRARCTGHGRCYAAAPEVFGCDDDGFGVVLVDETAPGDERLEAAVQRGIEACPEGAISLVTHQ